MEEKKGSHVLEINLVSDQDLKLKRGMNQTYAVVWVDDSLTKLRTRTDSFGDQNPSWNDKFLFRVSSEFISSATAGFNVEIYTVGRHFMKDSLVGTARCLISCCRGKSITTVHVHRPSGSFHGFLNVAAEFRDNENVGADLGILQGCSAVNLHELTEAKTGVEEESNKRSLLKKFRSVRSSPSLSTMSEQSSPLNKPEVATIRAVKSDSSLSRMALSFGHEQGPAGLKTPASMSSLRRKLSTYSMLEI